MRTIPVSVDARGATTPLPHTWSRCVGAGRACEGLRAGWQAQLKEAVAECGFEYIRFHGLLSDDMFVYREADGRPQYSFQYIDALFDALRDIGIRPVVEFSFCPKDLRGGERDLFWWGARIDPPRDLEKWGDLIAACCRHWTERYGVEEVRRWYFEVWNEPNLNMFWNGSRQQYFALYARTAQAVKSVDPQLRVGGPVTSNFVPDGRFDGQWEDTGKQMTHKVEDLDALPWHGVWISEFLAFCGANGLPVDFVSAHPYPTDFALDGYGVSSGRTRKASSLEDDVAWLKKAVGESPYPQAPLLLTEWSSSPSSRDCSHDRLPAAAYVMRENLAVAGEVECLSYWTFTDIFEELGGGFEPFHGGFGLLNFNGVKKPTYHAYRMMHRLGSRLLLRDSRWAATLHEGGRFAAVLWNYPEEEQRTVPMSPWPDHSVAREEELVGQPVCFALSVKGLAPARQVSVEIVDRSHGSVATAWDAMGSPANLTPDQTEALRQASCRTRKLTARTSADGELRLDLELPPWAICLVEEEPQR